MVASSRRLYLVRTGEGDAGLDAVARCAWSELQRLELGLGLQTVRLYMTENVYDVLVEDAGLTWTFLMCVEQPGARRGCGSAAVSSEGGQ